jgi:hypothetical protein
MGDIYYMRMLGSLTAAAMMMALAGLHAPVSAQTVDQADIINNTLMAGFSQTDLAQSFTPSAGTSAGAAIFLDAGSGGSGDITIQLWSALPNQDGAAELASGTALGTAGNWVDVFWSQVSLVPDSTYYLVFTSTNQNLGISGDVTDQYTGGNVFANPGYNAFPYDYTFQEFSDNAPIPEPASFALMGIAVLAVAAAATKWRPRFPPLTAA